uniref:Uncharacterized protein n=1 Tax=Pithovirus LCPAC401 TaxID=2506595 RepID=A0A481ZA48_9VIRU|nr:MAG: hypothetical protein LCPAC401_04260 [Pithovirus LCPAC401]
MISQGVFVTLDSHCGMRAACTQYSINNNALVKITLYGSEHYCCLKSVDSPDLKNIAKRVGEKFDDDIRSEFFNVTHTLKPYTSKQETNSSEENKEFFEIFSIMRVAFQMETNMKLTLNDVSKITVSKAIDRNTNRLIRKEPLRVYELGLTLSKDAESRLKVKESANFRKFENQTPKGYIVYAMGVGQTSIF